jgi:YVTN family beta-propeller protein
MGRNLVLVAGLTLQGIAAVAISPKPRPTLLRNCGPFLSQTSVRVWPAAGRRLPTHPNGIVSRIRLIDGRPYGVAVARDGTMYVALIGTSLLRRGDLRSEDFTDPVYVGSTPPHVVINPAGTRAYATLQTDRAIAVIDVASNSVLATVPLSSDGFNLAVTPTGDRVYATTVAGTLYVMDANSFDIVDTLSVGAAANGLAFSPDECTLYVTSRDAGTVTAISTVSHRITRIYSVGGMPQRIAVAPDGSEIYVANETAGLNVINVESGIVHSVSFGTPAYGVGLTPDAEQLYVLLPAAGEVQILDRTGLSPIKRLSVGGTPRNIAFDSRGTTALITTEAAVVFVR